MSDDQLSTHAELFDLTGKRALVTGGTRGVGAMMTRGLLQVGACVVISSRKAEGCQHAEAQLSKFGEVRAVPADLSRHDECLRLAEEVAGDGEPLHILVNNAGATWGEPLDSFPDSAWDKVLDLNVKSPFWLVQALLPAPRRGHRGRSGANHQRRQHRRHPGSAVADLLLQQQQGGRPSAHPRARP